ncbi:MAG: DegT/DnrJ/EryC1/StrS family aminotransferase [Flavobacteriaceae bacterium]|nr:DegT/DnrJ/EryC1/StrS family aminotransferase [Flavobacteriaceae bacterium]
MEEIRMVDLKGQYSFIKKEIDVALEQIFQDTDFINGKAVWAFQNKLQDYLGINHVIPCANGTDALQIALMALDLKQGDEVITADFTFAATVEVIALLKLKPVLVDVDPHTFNLDPQAVAKAITPNTKAIIPVHLFGQASSMEPILSLAKKHQLFVVEDNAQGIGATYTFSDGKKVKTGVLGDVGTTSFFPSKNLGAYGDGGAIFTKDKGLAEKIRGIVNHGMYTRYYHDVVGVNSRLDSLQAAILSVKLNNLDFYNERRKAAALYYNQLLSENKYIITPYREKECDSHVYHQYTLKISNQKRDALASYLQGKKIPFGIYYPVPLHQQKAYSHYGFQEHDFPSTNQLVKEVISLPMHTELTTQQIEYICNHILNFLNNE